MPIIGEVLDRLLLRGEGTGWAALCLQMKPKRSNDIEYGFRYGRIRGRGRLPVVLVCWSHHGCLHILYLGSCWYMLR